MSGPHALLQESHVPHPSKDNLRREEEEPGRATVLEVLGELAFMSKLEVLASCSVFISIFQYLSIGHLSALFFQYLHT